MKTPASLSTPGRPEMERAFAGKDPGYDGVFFVAVKTTGIFCLPSCPSRPRPENLEYFGSVKECLSAGYRPCKRCRPLQAAGAPPRWVEELIARVEASPEAPFDAAALKALGISPERARRWFERHYGMTFAAWRRGYRLAAAFTSLREGAKLDDAILDSGFESHSGFREAFGRTFGAPPGRARRGGEHITLARLASPLGPLYAGATGGGICLLDYADRRKLREYLEALRRSTGCAVVPGGSPLLERLRGELEEYFAGLRRDFSLPLAPRGTPFQELVWREVRRIPYGETISYQELARRLGRPDALRAAARANALNRLCLLIPCHRVTGKDGHLTGYGGGLWRKRLLLELEREGRATSAKEDVRNAGTPHRLSGARSPRSPRPPSR